LPATVNQLAYAFGSSNPSLTTTDFPSESNKTAGQRESTRCPPARPVRAGVAPDGRVAEAIELVRSKRDGDGRWPLKTRHPGAMPVAIDEGEGRPSRWITLRALRVLHWYAAGN